MRQSAAAMLPWYGWTIGPFFYLEEVPWKHKTLSNVVLCKKNLKDSSIFNEFQQIHSNLEFIKRGLTITLVLSDIPILRALVITASTTLWIVVNQNVVKPSKLSHKCPHPDWRPAASRIWLRIIWTIRGIWRYLIKLENIIGKTYP